MSEKIAMPAPLVAELRKLNIERRQADDRFNTAGTAVLLTLGLDPALDHHFNLDTGMITPAQPAEPKADPA